MQRLLADAEKLSGVKYDLSSYADIVEAIHVVQTEMGITGTTAKEASETISGSLGMLKSSWQNLVTGLADENADLDTLIGNVVESAETAANNLVPVMEKALTGIATLIEKIVPVITEKLPDLVSKILPPLIGAATQIVVGLVKALPQIITVLVEQAPLILTELGKALIEVAPILGHTALDLIQRFANYLIEHAGEAGEKFGQIMVKIIEFIIKAIPLLAEAAVKIVASLAMFIVAEYAQLIKAGAQIVAKIGEGIKNTVKEAFHWGADLLQNFINGIVSKISALWDRVKSIGQGIKDFLGFSEPKKGPLSNFHTFAPDMMQLFAQGIKDNEHLVTDQIAKSFDFGVSPISAVAGQGGGYAGSSLAMEQVAALLAQYLPEIASKRLTVDGTSLARNLTPAIDERLGVIQNRRGRESYAFAGG